MAWSPVWEQTADMEEGDLTDFDAAVGSDMIAHADALYTGSFGMKVTIPDSADRLQLLTGPVTEGLIAVEFAFDPNSSTMVHADQFAIMDLYSVDNRELDVEIQWVDGTGYRWVVGCYSSAAWGALGSYHLLSDAYHLFRVAWQASSGANDGLYYVWVDDELIETVLTINNDTGNIETMRVGAVGLDVGTVGTIYFDDIRWCDNILIPSALDGTLTPAGTITKFITSTYAGILSFVGTLTKLIKPTAFTGMLTSSGSITKKAKKALTGVLSFIGTILNKVGINVNLTFYLTPSGVVDLNLTPDGDVEVDLTPEGTVELRRS